MCIHSLSTNISIASIYVYGIVHLFVALNNLSHSASPFTCSFVTNLSVLHIKVHVPSPTVVPSPHHYHIAFVLISEFCVL